jgi:hypothetical protein
LPKLNGCGVGVSDDGVQEQNPSEMAAMGIPVFACTPDKFPDMMAAAINRADFGQWAAAQEIVTARA